MLKLEVSLTQTMARTSQKMGVKLKHSQIWPVFLEDFESTGSKIIITIQVDAKFHKTY